MKINSLYIASFGGIKNLKLDFSDDFNIIYGNNEDGKSTVMAFIKMMFYGSERGGNTLSKNIRKNNQNPPLVFMQKNRKNTIKK